MPTNDSPANGGTRPAAKQRSGSPPIQYTSHRDHADPGAARQMQMAAHGSSALREPLQLSVRRDANRAIGRGPFARASEAAFATKCFFLSARDGRSRLAPARAGRRSFNRTFLIFAALVVPSLGCSDDECAAGEVACGGNVASTCVAKTDSEISGHNVWSHEDCAAKHCVIAKSAGSQKAICALETKADARCPEVGEATACGTSGTLVCRDGYVVGNEACPAETSCVAFRGARNEECSRVALCSRVPTPDPLCGGGAYTACDGDVLVTCRCGVRESAQPCTSPGARCVVILDASASTRETAACR